MAAIPSERQVVILANVPNGEPVESDYEVKVTPLAAAGDDDLVLETLYLSVDPYLRILMRGGDKVGYAQPFQKGDEILGYGVCRVLKGSGAFQQGDLVVASVPWADYNVIKTSPGINKVPEGANPLTFLSAAGLTGLTAYFGILQVGALESLPQGSTVYVSGAAGATGNVVGQIAKIKGYRVVGSAGSEEKVNWLINDLGFDAAFNYKTSEDYVASLRQAAPNGIDLYFDNVGGEMFDAVLKVINDRGVIVNCGAISLYNTSGVVLGPRVETFFVLKQLRMQGMLVFSFVSQFPTAVKDIFGWIEEGKLKDRVTVFPGHGIPSVARGFIEMLKGTNIGKMVVKVKDE